MVSKTAQTRSNPLATTRTHLLLLSRTPGFWFLGRRGRHRARLPSSSLCRLLGHGLTWLRISPTSCKRANQLGYEKMRPLTSPLRGIDSVFGSQQLALRLRQSLLTRSFGLNRCELLRLVATREKDKTNTCERMRAFHGLTLPDTIPAC